MTVNIYTTKLARVVALKSCFLKLQFNGLIAMRFRLFIFFCIVCSYEVLAGEDFWLKTNDMYAPPYFGSILSLAINSNGDVFAGATGKGIFRSSNNGDSWTLVNTWTAKSIAINSSGYIFAGTSGGGMCRSTDNGASWAQVNNGLGGNFTTYIEAVAINSSGHVFATILQSGWVCRTTDNGANWTAANIGYYGTGSIMSLVINSGGYIFASTNEGIYRSANNGTNWIKVNTGLADTNVQVLAVNSSGHIYAGTNGGRVYRSIDNGINWTQIGLTSASVRSLAINSSGYIFAGTNGGGVYRSTDDGGSWTQINSGLTNISVGSLAINSGGYVFAGAADAAVFRSVLPSSAEAPPSVGLSLSVGWNLVSVPFIRTNDSASVVFPTKFGSMFGYNSATGTYSEIPILETGHGYWVYYSSGASVTISGSVPGAVMVACQAGWNLIGSRNTPVTVSALQVSAGQIFGGAFAYNPTTSGYAETLVINPGDAIWLYVTAACTLTIP
jgi:hypothetical protein